MSPSLLYVKQFELPTARPSTVEYKFDPRTNMCEVWCTVYYSTNGRRTIAESTFIIELEWLPMNDCGVLWQEEAFRHFIDHYASRRWSSLSKGDTPLDYISDEQWL